MNDVIEHHGVKGQRWGVRTRIKSALGTKKKSTSPTAKQTQVKWKKTYANRGKMSDKELQAAVNRLNLENQLAQSISRIPRTRSQKAVSTIGKFAGNIVSQQVGSFLTNQINSYIKKKVTNK